MNDVSRDFYHSGATPLSTGICARCWVCMYIYIYICGTIFKITFARKIGTDRLKTDTQFTEESDPCKILKLSGVRNKIFCLNSTISRVPIFYQNMLSSLLRPIGHQEDQVPMQLCITSQKKGGKFGKFRHGNSCKLLTKIGISHIHLLHCHDTFVQIVAGDSSKTQLCAHSLLWQHHASR